MKGIITKSIDFILFGNLFVALGASFLVCSTIIQLKLFSDLFYICLVFFATLFIYNLQRIFYKKSTANKLQSKRRVWIFKNPITIKVLTFIGFLGVGILYFFNDPKIFIYLLPLLFLSLFYFLPFIKLRKRAWFKLLILSFVWTITTSVIPILLTSGGEIEEKYFLHIATRFCFMIAICIPFDIRDLHVDKFESTTTIPLLYGENKSRWIAGSFMMVYVLLILIEYYIGIFNQTTAAILAISALINTILIFMSNSKRNEYFYTAVLDGTMVIQGGLLLFIHFVFIS